MEGEEERKIGGVWEREWEKNEGEKDELRAATPWPLNTEESEEGIFCSVLVKEEQILSSNLIFGIYE